MSPAPAHEYRRRLEQRRAEHARLTGVDAKLGLARLVAFAAALLLLVLAYRNLATPWLLAAPVVFFVFLVKRHDRVIRGREAAGRAITFYERGLGRIDDRWAGTGEPGDRFRDDRHLYANDLDLFGHASLFELLSIARTRAGEETLASWLKTAAAPDEIRDRQEAAAELTGALDLREALSLAGAEVRAGVHSDALLAWAEGPFLLSPLWLRWAALALTATLLSTIGLWVLTGEGRPVVAILAVQALFSWPQRPRLDHALHGADAAARDLDILVHLLAHIERGSFSSTRLMRLQQTFATMGLPASHAIRALHRLVEMHDWQHNLIFLLLSLPLMWGTHVAWAIESWRRRHGRSIRAWLGAVGEFEALSSLSGYRYEHPADPFPEIVTLPGDPLPVALFEGVALGHPLLPAARMSTNDVRLGGEARLIVVSGSNMSGKSTLLRTVGINAVLALAGAPVRAGALRLSPLRIGATLRIQDSLQEGRSRFYAEITRIRELTDLAGGSPPLLFLLDELFHGTNSHDRLAGASGVLRSLLDRGSIGLITTHDLALTAIADELAPRAVNVHFEDWFENGTMRFDYRMKPGRVTRSNAIALMRSVGLDL
jgi:hypothetical protein